MEGLQTNGVGGLLHRGDTGRVCARTDRREKKDINGLKKNKKHDIQFFF